MENLRTSKNNDIFFRQYGVCVNEGVQQDGEILRPFDLYEQHYHKWCCVCGKKTNGEGIKEPEQHRMFCKECYPLRQRVIDAHKNQLSQILKDESSNESLEEYERSDEYETL